VVESGVFNSAFVLDAPLWVNCSNVEFDEGLVKKSRGWSIPAVTSILIDDATGNVDSASGNWDDGGPAGTFSTGIATTIRGLQQQMTSAGAQRVFYGTVSNIYLSTGGTGASVGSGYAGYLHEASERPATCWSMESWGDWMLATNGVDSVQVYKGSSFAALGGISGVVDTAQVLLVLGPHVLLFNTDNDEKEVRWCAHGNPEQWNTTTYATAGAFTLREMEGPIVAAEPLGQQIGVYSRESMHIVAYRGAPTIFGWKPALQGVGAISKHAIIPVGRIHYGWGPDGIFETDGSVYRYIDTPALKKYIKDNLVTGQKSKIWGYFNEAQNRPTWYFPTGVATEPDAGIGFNVVNRSWTIYGYGRTAAVARNIFSGPLAADESGNVFLHESGVDANGSALVASLESKPLFGYSTGVLNTRSTLLHNWKYIDEILLRLRDIAGTGVKFQVGYKNEVGDAYTWTTAAVVTEGFNAETIDKGAVFFALKITTENVSDDFSLAGFDITGRPEGAYR